MDNSKDIVGAIQNFFHKQGRKQEQPKPLNPTKAALFGLDHRLKAVEEKLDEKRIKRSAFQKRASDENIDLNRHSYPS